MKKRIVVEAINTGTRNTNVEWYRDLILLYDDGTWERLFRYTPIHKCNLTKTYTGHMRGYTRDQVIAKLEDLIRDGDITGRYFENEDA